MSTPMLLAKPKPEAKPKAPRVVKPKKVKDPVNQKRGRTSKAKGSTFERLVAFHFKNVFPEAKRGIGQARSAKEVADVDGTPLWIEAKHKKNVTVMKALEQASAATDGRPCVVVWRKNGQVIMASMDVPTFLQLFTTVTKLVGPGDFGAPNHLVHQDLATFLSMLKNGYRWT